ncbi:MAG TPA: hypothetical protein VFA11_13160 [Acidimicrobiales bacterium]|nr:hypothetical protein [Acidimicrobiales bacterium]
MLSDKTWRQRYRDLPATGRASVVTLGLILVVLGVLVSRSASQARPVSLSAAGPAGPVPDPKPFIVGSPLQPGPRQMPVTTTTAPPATTTTSQPTTTTMSPAAPAAPLTVVKPIPPSTRAPAPTTVAAGGCVASMSDSAPPPGSYETVKVSSAPPDAPGSVAVHYRTQTDTYPISTDPSGAASYVFSIGTARSGFTVPVVVTVGPHAACSTSFTPQ